MVLPLLPPMRANAAATINVTFHETNGIALDAPDISILDTSGQVIGDGAYAGYEADTTYVYNIGKTGYERLGGRFTTGGSDMTADVTLLTQKVYNPAFSIDTRKQSANGWKVVGPGGGGLLNYPFISPYDPNIQFMTTDMGGSYMTQDGGKHWVQTNTGLNTVNFDPNIPNRIYIGAGGLFRSDDNGTTWEQIAPTGDNQAFIYVKDGAWAVRKNFNEIFGDSGVVSIAIDPRDSNNIYILTASGGYTGPNAAIFHSSDAGQTWQILIGLDWSTIGAADYRSPYYPHITKADMNVMASLYFDADNNRLVLFTDEGIFGIALQNNLNLPTAWTNPGNLTAPADPWASGAVKRLVTPPVAMVYDSGVYSLSWGTDKSDGKTIFYMTVSDRTPTTGDWLYRLYKCKDLDNGQWEHMAGLDKYTVQTTVSPYAGGDPYLHYVRRMQTCLSDASVIYVSAHGSNSLDGGVLKSADYGETFNWVYEFHVVGPGGERDWYSPGYEKSWLEYNNGPSFTGSPFDIAVCGSDPNICLIADTGAHLTKDGGSTWKCVSSEFTGLDAAARNDIDALEAARGKPFTNHRGESPTESDFYTYNTRGIDLTNCYGVYANPFNPMQLVACYTDIGMWISDDGGATWRQALEVNNWYVPGWGGTDYIPVNWYNTCYDTVFDPDVPGKAWSVWSGLHNAPRYLDWQNKNLQTQVGGGVCRTEAGVNKWTAITPDTYFVNGVAQPGVGLPASSMPTDIAIDLYSSGSVPGNRTLYCAVFGRGIYKSTDDGIHWVLKNNGIDPSNLKAYKLDIASNGYIYAGFIRDLSGNTPKQGGVYVSKDGGDSWQALEMPVAIDAAHGFSQYNTQKDIKGAYCDRVNFIQDLKADPTNPNRIYIVGYPNDVADWAVDSNRNGGVWKSEDGGATWECIFDRTCFTYGIGLDPNDSSRILLATSQGASYYSSDGGVNWSLINGYQFKNGTYPYFDPNNSNYAFICTFGGSIEYGPVLNPGAADPDYYKAIFTAECNALPLDVSGAAVYIKDENGVIVRQNRLLDGHAYTYYFELKGYFEKEGSFTVNSADVTIPLTLEETPDYCTVTFRATDSGTGQPVDLAAAKASIVITDKATGAVVKPNKLVAGQTYSYRIAVKSYQPVTKDDFTVPGDLAEGVFDFTEAVTLIPVVSVEIHVVNFAQLQAALADPSVEYACTIILDADITAPYGLAVSVGKQFELTSGGGVTRTIICADVWDGWQLFQVNGTSALIINGVNIDLNNKARAVTVNGGELSVINSVIRNGYAGSGGAIMNQGGTLEITNSVLKNNNCWTGGWGGAIYNIDLGVVTITGSEIIRNSGDRGGGIYTNGALTITDSKVDGNVAGAYGGGIFNAGNLIAARTEVKYNRAGQLGGGISNDNIAKLIDCDVSENFSGIPGYEDVATGAYGNTTVVITVDPNNGPKIVVTNYDELSQAVAKLSVGTIIIANSFDMPERVNVTTGKNLRICEIIT